MKLYLDRLPDDWKADWLVERETTVLELDGSNSVHRVQHIRARHGDHEYEEKKDLGRAGRFQHEPLYILAGGLTPVGRVREMAERIREQPTLAQERGFEVPDIPNLYREYAEELWRARNNPSVFGGSLIRVRS